MMGRNISALAAGLVFGLGLVISQMVNPAKVIAFLDIFGEWDPSLALVMAGALIVTAIGYRLVWTRERPILSERFQLPGNRQVDKPLAIGAILFGIGWGLVGLCPGPAITALSIGGADAALFLAAMAAGMIGFQVAEPHLRGS